MEPDWEAEATRWRIAAEERAQEVYRLRAIVRAFVHAEEIRHQVVARKGEALALARLYLRELSES